MITVDLSDYRRMYERVYPELKKQIPFALSVALNRTLKAAKESDLAEVKVKLDRPSPYITKGWWIKFSDKHDLTGWVGPELFGAPNVAPADILAVQEVGGERGMKPSERRLGSYWTPGFDVPRDAYGNIKGSAISEMLTDMKMLDASQWRTKATLQRRMKRGEQPRHFFRRGNVVFQVVGDPKDKKVLPFLILIKEPPKYKQLIDLKAQGEAVAAEVFPNELRVAFAYAIATARKA